jgi:hypothetical protein
MPRFNTHRACFAAVVLLAAAGASPAPAATLSRSVDVQGDPAAVWSMIGPFCAIKDWHPAIGACSLDGRSTPTRTLVTKDGKATFVELQTGHAARSYSYTFVSSPLPVSHYSSTITVRGKAHNASTVTWSGTYTPDPGREAAADAALSGIYESGLAAIKAKLGGGG